jgi:beta-carotene hydroxylase
MRASRIIRYPIDIISVLVVLSTVSLQLFALLRDWPWYAVLPILLMLRQVSLVEHNHAHLTIFPTRFASILLGWLCHLSSGVPLDTYRVHHVMSHHRYNNRFDSSGRDWSSIFGFRGTRLPDRPVGKAYYVASFPFIAHAETLLWFLRAPTSKLARGFFVSMAVIGSVSIFLFWLNAFGFVTFFLLPWTVLLFGMGYNNYDHHVGCNMTGKYDSANNFVNFYYTVLSFNEGYHVAHHLNPGVHWSLLPNIHDVVERGRLSESGEAFPRAQQLITRNFTPAPECPGPGE